jgi:hypothetical protein
MRTKLFLITTLIFVLASIPAAKAQGMLLGVGTITPSSVNNGVVYDSSSTGNIGANVAGVVSTTVGSGLNKQGLVLLVGLDDSGPYHLQAASPFTVNSSGLVPVVWQKVGSYVTGNGNYHGECWVGTGASFSGPTSTYFRLTGTSTSPSQVIQYSFGYVNQSAPTSAGSGTCVSATSGAQAATLAATNDMAAFSDFDTNNNRTASGCTTSTDLTGFTQTGYSGAHCGGSTSESLTWNAYGATSVAVAQAVPHDNGSLAPACAFEGYNPFTGGTSGTNAVSNLSTLLASEHGNNPGVWTGTGTIAWGTTDTGLLNNSSKLCGDLTSYGSGSTSLGLVETGTGSAATNNVEYGLSSSIAVPTASRSFKFCTDASSSSTLDVDLGLIHIGSDYINTAFQCNGTSCFFNLETSSTSNTLIANYTTGGSCSAGGSGWVTIVQQINETGTGCSGSPCSFVNLYGNTGTLLASQTGTATGVWGSGDQLNFVIGHLGSQTLPSGTHFYFAKDVHNYQGTFPPDM